MVRGICLKIESSHHARQLEVGGMMVGTQSLTLPPGRPLDGRIPFFRPGVASGVPALFFAVNIRRKAERHADDHAFSHAQRQWLPGHGDVLGRRFDKLCGNLSDDRRGDDRCRIEAARHARAAGSTRPPADVNRAMKSQRASLFQHFFLPRLFRVLPGPRRMIAAAANIALVTD